VITQEASGRAVRAVTGGAVLLVAAVAAVVSYVHMATLAREAGEGWRALLLPLSVDGLVVAASMVLVTRRRAGCPVGGWRGRRCSAGSARRWGRTWLPRILVTARLVAAWPVLAFAVAFELLLQQRRVPVVRLVEVVPDQGSDHTRTRPATNRATRTTSRTGPAADQVDQHPDHEAPAATDLLRGSTPRAVHMLSGISYATVMATVCSASARFRVTGCSARSVTGPP